MPSAFSLYGTLSVDTGAFEKSLRDSEARLKGAQAELGKTQEKSKQLGDTSFTVSRRYEKLNEAIAQNASRLSEAVAAYTRGEISAKKYASVLTQVERATAGVNSRIKDAFARVSDINSSGLTHFQQQVKGATSELSNLSGILTGNRLSGVTSEFTSLGLAIGSLPGPAGLAAGALATLATAGLGVGGVLFGLSKEASDFGSVIHDTAEKTGLSTKVISSIKVAADESSTSLENVSKGLRRFTLLMADAASGSDKSAQKLRDLHVTSTDLTEGLGQVIKQIYLLPAGLQQNEAAAEAFGKKLGADLIPFINQFQGDLPGLIKETERLGLTIDGNAADAADRFGDTLETTKKQVTALGYQIGFALLPQVNDLASSFSNFLAQNKEQTAAWAKSIANEFETVSLAIQQEKNDAQALGEILNTLNPFSNETWDSLPERLKKYTLEDERISIARSRIGKTNDSPFNLPDDYADRFSLPYATKPKFGLDDEDAQKTEEPAKKIKEHIKSIADEAEKTAKRMMETKNAVRDLFQAATKTDNPYIKIFDDSRAAIDRATEATRGLSQGIRDAVLEAIKGKRDLDDFAQGISDAVEAAGYGKHAKEFGQGYLDDNNPRIKGLQSAISQETDPGRKNYLQGLLESAQNGLVQSNFQSTLDAIGNLNPVSLKDIPIPKGLTSATDILKNVPNASQVLTDASGKALKAYGFLPDPEKQHVVDQAVIKAASGIDPAKLTRGQDDIISGAYDREAKKAVLRESDAAKRDEKLNAILKKLDESIQKGTIVRIVDETKGKVRVTQNPTQATTDDYYK